MKLTMKLTWLYPFFVLLVGVDGLNENLAKERKCIKVETSKDIDWEWMVTKWYYPLWSKLDLYRTASDSLAKPIIDIPDITLQAACFACDVKPNSPLIYCQGFNKTQIPYEITISDDQVFHYKIKNSPYGLSGTHTLVYSDNKKLIVGTSCWEDNEMSWSAWTVEPILQKEEKIQIMKVITDLGFNPDFAIDTAINHKHCPYIYETMHKTDRIEF